MNRAIYQDGVLIPVKAGQSADPKPVAGTEGTIITVRMLAA
jgi:DNA mismatch repair protein MLH1